MKLSNSVACSLSLDLGLCISIWSATYDHEMARGYGIGVSEEREPDLRVTPDLGDDLDHPKNSGWNDVVALTPDGAAFLDLVDEHQGECSVC